MARNPNLKDGSKGDGVETRIKKGEVRNPWGKQGKHYALTHFKQLTREQLQEVADVMLWGNITHLKSLEKDPSASALVAMLASVAVRIHEKGDMYAFDLLLNRILGKVSNKVEVSGATAGQVVQITLPSNGRERLDARENEFENIET